jgi:inner membrane protein
MDDAFLPLRSPGRMSGIGRAAVPVLLVALVLACDALLPAAGPNLVLTAALDEPAHLATAALVLLAVLGPRRLRWPAAVALAAAVLIDLDHIPLYLGLRSFAPFGRPVTHSLLTPLVLAALAVALPGRPRRVLAAAAAGVCLHLVRDVATGPGVGLLWPVDARNVLLPYPWYAAAVGALGVVGVVRLLVPERAGRRGPTAPVA